MPATQTFYFLTDVLRQGQALIAIGSVGCTCVTKTKNILQFNKLFAGRLGYSTEELEKLDQLSI